MSARFFSVFASSDRKLISKKEQAVLQLVMEEMKYLVSFSRRHDRWLHYPFATKPESEMLVTVTKGISGLSDIHQARLSLCVV